MKKTFCDRCNEEIFSQTEIPKAVEVPTGLARPNYTLVVTTKPSDGTTVVDLCKYCVIEAFTRLDDRPQCAPKTPDSERLHAILDESERSIRSKSELIQHLRNEFS